MTLLPCEAQRISYAKETLPAYEVPVECAHPTCDFPAFEKHHVVRRSYTQGVGPQIWVRIDDQSVPNLVGLCRHHHDEITNNRARISWDAQWFWSEKEGREWVNLAPLSPVPLAEDAPVSSLLGEDGSGGVLSEREATIEGGPRTHSRSTDSEGQTPPAAYGASAATVPSEICSGCGRKLPKPKAEQEEARPRTRWTIAVPKDHREDGADLLDQAIQAAALRIGYAEDTPKYFIVMRALDYVAYVASEEELAGIVEAA